MKDKASAPKLAWPLLWSQFFDEAVPAWTKKKYYPKKNSKDRPFSDADAKFFSSGIVELSQALTEDRKDTFHSSNKRSQAYFQHPRFRSSYLLYFFQMQAAKFYSLFQTQTLALKPLLAGRKIEDGQGPVQILDLGAGPGTASFAFLMSIAKQLEKNTDRYKDHPGFEFLWVDPIFPVLKDGEALFHELIRLWNPPFPVKIRILESTLTRFLRPQFQFDFVLMGNVLNEIRFEEATTVLNPILERLNPGAGVLILEPAARGPAQLLSQIRDAMELPIIGPCLHSGKCPMSTGRDWCHFSEEIDIPGKWFTVFSKALGSKREFLKYSYLWLASPQGPALPPSDPEQRLVVSDPIVEEGKRAFVLLCEPDRTRRHPITLPTAGTGKGGGVSRKDLQYRGKRLRLAPFQGPAVKVGYVKKD